MEQDKKQQLVETALNLFYRHGVHAVGINQILEESAIAKKTLYHHFTGKDELLMATLELRHQRFCLWLDRQFESSGSTNSIEKLFDALSLWFEGKTEELGPFFGCYFQNCAAEYHGPDSAVLTLCARHKLKIRSLINNRLYGYQLAQQAQSSLLDGLMLLKEGAISMALLQQNSDAAKQAKKQALLLLSALN